MSAGEHPTIVETATDAVQDVLREAVTGGGDAPGRGVELLGRIGLVAYGLVHLIIAGLAVRLAVAADRTIEADPNGAVDAVAALGVAGTVLLAVSVAGLVAFGVWQLCAAASGFRWVDGGERTRKRLGAVAKSIAVLAVAATALPALLGYPTGRGDDGVRAITARILALPAGPALVTALGVTALVIAGSMVYTGVRATFMTDLHRNRLGPWLRRTAVITGSFGNLARSVAFAGVGVLLLRAVLADDPARSGGVGQALLLIADHSFGMVSMLVVALGIGAFGVYCVIDAHARRA